jgi:small-conductance mechanosensitive channel
LFGRAVKKGDWITAGERFGQVQTVGARSITLRTNDNVELLVPTADIVNATIINWTHSSPTVRVRVRVGASYNAQPRTVREALLAAAAESDTVLHLPAPRVWLVGFGDSSVDYDLLVWVNIKRVPLDSLKGELYFVIWDKLAEAGIEIPFPQRDIHIRSAVAVPIEQEPAQAAEG